MIDALVVQEIFDDVNFKTLVDDKTDSEEFARLLQEHVRGYSQKKRFSDGLKDFTKKVEDAENRLIVARNVGKYKEPDPEDKHLTSNYTSHELKAKATTVNAQLQTMIDEGSITFAEKTSVIDNLRTRLAKAKEAGKPKLEEKLDKSLTSVCKSEGFTLPVANIEQFHELDKELQAIQKLEKLPSRSVTAPLRERIENKAAVQGDYDTLVETSRMWFETELEFKPRLHAAIIAYAAAEEERKRIEADQAFQKELAEQDAAVEKKRLEAEKKKLEATKALEEKLEAKRLEAAAKPVKEVPKKQPKEKKYVARVDVKEMFKEDMELDYEEVSAAQIQADLEAEAKQREFAKAYAELKKANVEAEEAKKARAIVDAKEAKLKAEEKKMLLEKKAEEQKVKDAKAAARAAKKAEEEKAARLAAKPVKTDEEKFKAIEEKLAAKRAEAELNPKKEVKEPPKKEKKVAAKMSLLDFYSKDEDNVLERLAAQEAQEQFERQVAKEEAEKEAARLAEEEEAAWAAEEAAWAAEQSKAVKLVTVGTAMKTTVTETVTDKVAPVAAKEESIKKPVPKPKRKAPAVIPSKWGAPVVPTEEVWEDDDGMDLLDRLAAQEALEKVERAAAKEAAEKEAARLAAEEEEAEVEPGPAARSIPSLVVKKTTAPTVSVVNSTAAPTPAVVTQKVEPVVAPAPKPKRKPPVELENKWGAPVAPAPQVMEDGDVELSLEEELPTLAQALTAPVKKTPPPQPKKKEKKKWGKIDASAIGFDADNPNQW